MSCLRRFPCIVILTTFFIGGWMALSADSTGEREEPNAASETPEIPLVATGDSPVSVYVVPIHGIITEPTLFIVRRALKEAIENEIGLVVFDINTPGGAAFTTLDIMEAIDRFPGRTVAFINTEAVSAGAYITMVCDDIFFHPLGVIGAAEVVAGGGQEIPEAQKRKLDSYLGARQRVFTRQHENRGDILRAMSDPDFVFEIDGRVLKDQGELLSLTSDEAMETFGDPPRPLLASGIFESVEEILNDLHGEGSWVIRQFEITWSERVAQYLASVAPALLGIGLLLLFIEFKTPGFGVFGFAGISLLLLVFASGYMAGLAGHEPVLFFLLGVALVFIEVLLFPGMLVFAILGIVLILGSLIWAMSDFWPGVAFEFNLEMLHDALLNLLLGGLIAVAGAIFLARYLPRSSLWSKLVLEHAVGSPHPNPDALAQNRAITSQEQARRLKRPDFPPIGATGIAMTDLYPNGEVEVEGRRWQGRAVLGTISRNSKVRVVSHEDFGVRVEPVS